MIDKDKIKVSKLAIEQNPKDESNYLKLFELYKEFNLIEEGIIYFIKLKEKYNNSISYQYLGILYLLRKTEDFKNHKNALNCFEKVRELKDESLGLILLGYSYFVKRDIKNAKSYYDKAYNSLFKNQNSRNPELYISLGIYYEQILEFDMTIECFNHSINLKKDVNTYYFLALLYERIMNINKAIDNYKKVLEFNSKEMDSDEIYEKIKELETFNGE